MKKMVLFMALALVLVAVPAFADKTHWGVKGAIGGVYANDFTAAGAGSAGTNYTLSTFGIASANNDGGGQALALTGHNSAFASAGSGGEANALVLGKGIAISTNVNGAGAVAIDGFVIGGVVSGYAFGK